MKSIKNFKQSISNGDELNDLLVYDSDEVNQISRQKEICKWITNRIDDIKTAAILYCQSKKYGVLPYPKSYNQCRYGDHRGSYKKAIAEKQIARGLFLLYNGKNIRLVHELHSTVDIGCFEDYETPIFHTKYKGRGRNVDIISVKRGPNEKIYLHELKKNGSDETLLRCIMEAYTYSIMMDRQKLRHDFGLTSKSKIVICPMFFRTSQPYIDFTNLHNGKYSELGNLIKLIKERDAEVDIEFAILDADTLKGIMPKDSTGKSFKTKWLNM